MMRKIGVAALGVAAAGALAGPALAQYTQPATPQQPSSAAQGGSPAPAARTINISRGAHKAITELQAAVNANDATAYPAKLAAAQAAAKTPVDRFVIGQLQLKSATNRKDEAGMAAALEAMIASGGAAATDLPTLQMALAKLHYGAKQYDRAAAAIEQVLATDRNNAEMLLLLAETRGSQGRAAEAVTLFQRAIDARTAAGAKADESWYRRAIAVAHKGQQPTLELARKWVAAYPSPASWRDALNIYRNQAKPDDATLFDAMRLARAVGAIGSAHDASIYAYLAVENWAGADAKSMLDEAIAKGQFDVSEPKNKELLAAARSTRGQDAASLSASAKEVAAAPTGRNALKVGDGFYGIGDYARAVELYRLALSKGSVDANVVNLRIGAALARSGDKAAATTALNAVGGPQAELAKFWLLYLSTRA